LGTFFLVLVAAGSGMVNAKFGGDAVPAAAAGARAVGSLV
jgi:aquaporin Z